MSRPLPVPPGPLRSPSPTPHPASSGHFSNNESPHETSPQIVESTHAPPPPLPNTSPIATSGPDRTGRNVSASDAPVAMPSLPPLPPRAHSVDSSLTSSPSPPSPSPMVVVAPSPSPTPQPARPKTVLPSTPSSGSLTPGPLSPTTQRTGSFSTTQSPLLPHSVSSPSLSSSTGARRTVRQGVLGGVPLPTEAEFEAAHPSTLPPLVAEAQLRDKIAYEVLTSETSYVRSLRVLHLIWAPALKEHAHLERLHALLSQVAPLLRINEALWEALRARLSAWSATATIGDVFRDLTPFLKMYKAYTSGYEGAQTDLSSALGQENSRFALQHAELQALPLTRSLSLASYLIQPVQRLPRYVLLLADLLKNTPEGHADRAHLQSSLDGMRRVASEIEADMAAQENRLKCLAIQNRFGSSVQVVAAHRKFVLEGILVKQCRKERKPRLFFLFSDQLLYAQEAVGGLTMLLSGTLPMAQVRVQELPQGSAEPTGFNILAPGKSFTVFASSLPERATWINALKEAGDAERARLREKDGTPHSGAEEVVASVWASDDSATSCTLCSDAFTLLRRRHHCRKCGRVVCGKCSEGRMVVPAVDPTTAQRVCTECIKQSRNRTASSVAQSPLVPKS